MLGLVSVSDFNCCNQVLHMVSWGPGGRGVSPMLLESVVRALLLLGFQDSQVAS